jgi:outer membrane autotransporter protein
MAALGLADAGPQEAAAPGTTGPMGFAVWGEAIGGFGSRDGDGNAAGYDRTNFGGTVGLDYRASTEFLVGVAAHYLHTNADFDSYSDEVDVNSWGFSLYGSWQPGALYVDVGANLSFNSYDTSRTVPLGGGSTEAKADYNGTSWGLYGEVGYGFDLSSIKLTPSASVAYTSVGSEAFTETGAGGMSLKSDGLDADQLSTTIMLRASTSFAVGDGMMLMPELRAGWQHDFLDEPEVTNAFVAAPNSPFTVVGSEVSSDSALVGASLTLNVDDAIQVFVDYDGRFGSNDTQHVIGIGGRFAF